jgi:predicted Zn-dependent protease
MYEGEVEKTRRAIHDLSKFVGNDSVLDLYEANALLNNGDYEKAIFYCDKFISQKPGLASGYIARTIAYIENKDFIEE